MDADDLVMGEIPFPSDKTIDMYSVRYGQGFTYMRFQLFKSSEKWKYVGVLHEYPECVTNKNPTKAEISGNYYIDSRRLGDRNKAADKYIKDAKVLEQALKTDPKNVRYMFYLAQSYKDAKDYINSNKWYTKRAESGGWFEEVYVSLFEIANNKARLSDLRSSVSENNDWKEIEAAYMKAWNFLPSRAEPLYEIGKHYRETEQYRKAYNTLRIASKISFPKDQVLFLHQNVYDYEILKEMSICAYHLRRYQESFDIGNGLLFNPDVKLPDWERSKIEEIRDQNIDHILEDTWIYPVKKIIDIRKSNQNKNVGKGVIMTVTTCKRFDLFTKTINSFINCCQDLEKIDKWLCVDDNSSEEDREKMKKLYPFFEFVWKGPEEKGHVESMNIIYEKISEYQYNLHMEDDWNFFEPRKYLTDAITILSSNDEFGQLLFNRNYAERARCRNIAGGILQREGDVRYLIHEHYQRDTPEWLEFNRKYANRSNCMYWPHYSLRPSVLKVSALKKVGRFINETGHFEMDYAKRYFALGFRSAFLDTISCYHIGKCTWEKGDNSYSLNGVTQFSQIPSKLDIPVKTDDDWLIVPQDSYGNDIKCIPNADIEVLKFAALSDPNCIGFNTLGYLKSAILPEAQWISVSFPNFFMYVNKKRWGMLKMN